MTRKKRGPLFAAAGIFALTCVLVAATVAQAADPGTEDPNDWPQYHRTSNAWRYSPLDQINKTNVRKLKVAWIAQGGDITMGIQETPLAINGVVYSITAGNRVAALNGATGEELWRFEPLLDPLTKKIIFKPYSRGVAVGRGLVVIGTIDGRGIALDQQTGKERWQVQLTDLANCNGCNFTSPPVFAGDMLTFGSTGGDLATAAKIYGVEADTGKLVWQFDTIKDDPKSWPGESGKYGGGEWMPGTYDAETNTVYYGTSNPEKDFYGADREGDNLYTDSVVALDPRTGHLKWHQKEIRHDVWDYDSTYEALLFKKDGKDLLVHLNKSGFVFVLDKNNGDIENIWRLSETLNFAKDIDKKTGELIGRIDPEIGKTTMVCPSGFGARNWNSGAYSPKTGLWYTNVMEFCGAVSGKHPQLLQAPRPSRGLVAVAFVAPCPVGHDVVQVEHEHPYQAIIDAAASKGCDLIVMASHGRHGISAIVLGSETVKVLTHSKVPVLVYR